MSTNKHTPGPWAIERDHIGPRSQNDDQSYGMLIQVAYLERYDWPENAEANARLIAAAPELLEALEAIINDGGKFVMTQETHRAARAAIDKARGES